MKIIIIIVFLTFIAKISFGQLGLTMHDSLIIKQRTFYSPGPIGSGQGPLYVYTYYYYFINGDSTINGTNYKKLYKYSTSANSEFNFTSLIFNSLLLEDSNCIFQGTPGSMSKILDYNLQVGDSFKFIGYSPKQVLISIDSVLINGAYAKRFNFNKNIKWIKGIGDVNYGASFSNYDFLNPVPPIWDFWGSNFLCYAEYLTPIYNFGNYCNLPLNINQVNTENDFRIFPNPVFNNLNIEISSYNNFESIEIYSILGKKVKSILLTNDNIEIKVSDLPSGIYILKAEDKSHNIISKRFIKE
ncbi:MAG: T9SS type A sorting domain-containing protein [Bacteroidia bacterium]|nr:T9SS type A sorting domain-containing protein [Bacteroidia bacterium]